MRPSYLILLFIATFCLRTDAQTCGAVTYNADDGLGANNYMDIFQDSRGILWVGSYSSGVSRFDGKRWENWTQPNKIFSNTVQHIFEDKEGGLWFNHHIHGVSRLKDGLWQCFDYQQDTCVKGILHYNRQKKTVYIVETALAGKPSTRLFEYDYSARKFIDTGKRVMPENMTDQYDAFEPWKGRNENEWWVFANNNKKRFIDYYHFQNGQTRKLPAPPGTFDDYFNFLSSNAILSREAGEAVGHSKKGVFVLKNNRWQPLTLPKIPRYSNAGLTPVLAYAGCSFDEGSNSLFVVWYLSEKAREKRYLLAEYDPVTLYQRRTLLFDNPFWDLGVNAGRQIFKDAASTIWLSTSGNVLRLFPDQFYIPVTAPGMPAQAWSVAQAGDGNIWFASFGEGLAGFDGLYLTPPPEGLKQIRMFNDGSLTDEKGNVYFNNGDKPEYGILKFDGKKQWAFLAGGNRLTGFFLNRNKKGRILWGTSEHGLWILPEDKTGRDTSDWLKINRAKGLLLENVVTALEDRYGRYWMGRPSRGMAMYDPKTGHMLNWLRNQNANHYGCMSMAEDARGNLWFGTDRGLCFFENRPGIGPDFDLQKNLLPVGLGFIGESMVTSCLMYDAHTLVIGNTAGLHLLDLDAFYGVPRQVLLRSLQLKNGYQAGPVNQNALFVDRDSCIWLTAANGALRYDPRTLPRDMAIPGVIVDSLIAGRDTFHDLLSRLALSNDQRYVEIYFHVPPNPMLYDNTRFEYRLTGDSAWTKITPGAESVAFSSLKAGTYRFEIRAVKEGLLSVPAVVEFRISPVLWETPLFWLLILSTVIGIGALWWRREVKIADQNLEISNQQLLLEKDKNEMARMSKEKDKLQVQAIVNQLNPHFINNTLQWLQVRVDEDEEAVRVVGKLSENISTVFKNSRMKKAFHSLREELHLTENYLFIQKCRFGDRLTYEMPGKEILTKLENMCVPLMIVQIHAENAVEHGIRSKKTGIGRVHISLREDDRYAVITIEDDGVGRANAKKIGSKGTQNGTTMLKELETIYNRQNPLPLEQIYQDDIFMDAEGKSFGTRVIVRMPKDYNFEF